MIARCPTGKHNWTPWHHNAHPLHRAMQPDPLYCKKCHFVTKRADLERLKKKPEPAIDRLHPRRK